MDVTENPNFQAWFRGSKVVDSSGKPLLVYHGAGGKFRVFDMNRTRKTDIKGAFFSPNKNFAGVYGDQIAAYLRITNPATFEDVARHRRAGVPLRQVHTALKREGYDGVFDRKANVAVAFSSNQIKSASENSGKFNPRSSDIYEGRHMGPFETIIETRFSGSLSEKVVGVRESRQSGLLESGALDSDGDEMQVGDHVSISLDWQTKNKKDRVTAYMMSSGKVTRLRQIGRRHYATVKWDSAHSSVLPEEWPTENLTWSGW